MMLSVSGGTHCTVRISMKTGELFVCLIEIICFLPVVSHINAVFCFLGEYLSPVCTYIYWSIFKK